VQLASLGFRTDLMLLALQGSVVVDGGDHLLVRTPANPGFYWGNFVLAGEAWVDQPLADLVGIFRAQHPLADHVAIGVDGVDGRVWGDDEVGKCGLEVELAVVMTASAVLAPSHPNPDAVCRMLDSDADWLAAADLHGVDHHDLDPAVYRDYLQRRMAARRELQEAGHGGWFGAFVDERLLCGLGLFTDGSGLGRFQSVETLASARRLGLASTLVHHASMVGQADFGIQDLVMVADPEYSAIRIYRSLGFTDSEIQVQLALPTHGA
jgi:ribosomal protein S18 acetylase RimI-like enzyme